MLTDYYTLKGKLTLELASESKKLELMLNTDIPKMMEGIVVCSDYNSAKSAISAIVDYNRITICYYEGMLSKRDWRFDKALEDLAKTGIFKMNGKIHVDDVTSKANNFTINIEDSEISIIK